MGIKFRGFLHCAPGYYLKWIIYCSILCIMKPIIIGFHKCKNIRWLVPMMTVLSQMISLCFAKKNRAFTMSHLDGILLIFRNLTQKVRDKQRQYHMADTLDPAITNGALVTLTPDIIKNICLQSATNTYRMIRYFCGSMNYIVPGYAYKCYLIDAWFLQ